MLKYIFRRILLFIPTLFFISLLAFIINANAPGDPVEQLFNISAEEGLGHRAQDIERLKQQKRHELGLDLPLFYFSLHTLADIDTLHRIAREEEQDNLQRLARQYGNKQAVLEYYRHIQAAENALHDIFTSRQGQLDERTVTAAGKINFSIQNLKRNSAPESVRRHLAAIHLQASEHEALQSMQAPAAGLENAWEQMTAQEQSWKAWIPSLHFHGLNNQYHRWLSRLVTELDFGRSYRDQQPVMERLKERFPWSFVLAMLSIFFAFAVSIPIGVWAASKRGNWFDRSSSLVLFALYSLPNFFVGTMLLVFFANPDFLNIFPVSGIQDPGTFDANWPFFKKLAHWLPYLVLPFITYAYSSLAFLSRQMRASMLETLQQDYIRTARAKGLPPRRVLWKHALRNSLLPLITLFAHVLPLAIGGSVIVETIFAIPGMGREIYEAILGNDYPVITAIFVITGVLTLAGYLVSDILYAIADPRISYK